MSNYILADLDELVLKCRNDKARECISEAVICYKAGAFRSCIVATWVAVAFDILSKLSELELTGDQNARKKLDEFEQIRLAGDTRLNEAMQFEQNLLRMASDEFELLTPIELKDLETLRNDRHRCAHPSMISIDELYQPTPELARNHIRNAVEILLQREPVQGKAAFDRICGEIKSEYFPDSQEAAKRYFESSSLKRARKSLIRSLMLGLTKSNFNDNLPQKERLRQIVALSAIHDLHSKDFDDIMKKELANISIGVVDDNLYRILIYIKFIPTAWNALGCAMHEKLRKYLYAVPTDKLMTPLFNAMHIHPLKEIALDRIKDLSSQDLARLVGIDQQPEYIRATISRFANADNFSNAEQLGRTLLIIADKLDADQVCEVLGSIFKNAQLWSALRMPGIMSDFFDSTQSLLPKTETEWKHLLTDLKNIYDAMGPNTAYAGLQQKMEAVGIWPFVTDIETSSGKLETNAESI